MRYFFGYDIAHPRRLRKIARLLEQWGLRVQYSFFICDLSEEKKDELVAAIRGLMERREDSLVVYPLCERCADLVEKHNDTTLFRERVIIL